MGQNPSYFYETLDGNWVQRIAAFRINNRYEREDALAKLAKRGFLLVDTLPFALDYTAVRDQPAYLQGQERLARDGYQLRI